MSNYNKVKEKECRKCKVVKPLTDFYMKYKNKPAPNGWHNYMPNCRVCESLIRQKLYPKHREKRLEEHKLNYKKNREKKLEYFKKTYRTKKGYARAQMRNAIEKGELIRLPCEICGEIKSQGHHTNYDKPLEVRWLCNKHHKEVHRKYNPLVLQP